MKYADLLVWWVISISWSAVFLMGVSFYLYVNRRKRTTESTSAMARRFRMSDFVFIWVLAGLLGLYILSINRASSIIFALGNIVVEVILIVYTIMNRSARSQQALPRGKPG